MNLLFSPITLFTLLLVLCFWTGFLTYLVWRHYTLLNRLTKNTKGDGLHSMLQEVALAMDKSEKKADAVVARLDELHTRIPHFFQNSGFVRFNPYNEVGGDQSFSLALLDDRNRGFVLTSLHGRTTTRVYAKPIGDEPSHHPLSKEEEEAVSMAKKRENTPVARSR